MERKEFAKLGVIGSEKILEFGPSYNPMYKKKDGYNVEIVDHSSQESLASKGYTSEQGAKEIEQVDYVCSSNYYDFITSNGGGNYDVIAASHFIEHTTDIIAYLKDVSKLINPQGIVKLVIPDKRYEFDCFKELTSIRTVIDNHIYRKGQTKHSIGAIIDSKFTSVQFKATPSDSFIPNSAPLFGELLEFGCDSEEFLSNIHKLVDEYDELGYVDTHAWALTPKSFELLIFQLNILGYTDLIIDFLYVEKNNLQFFVQLKKGRYQFDPLYMKRLYIDHKREELEAFELFETVDNWSRHNMYIYVYGCGKGAGIFTSILDAMNIEIKGYVVSDGKRLEDTYKGHIVYEISEITDIKNETAFVISVLNNSVKEEIESDLIKNGYRNFI